MWVSRCWCSCDPMCSCVLGCVLACGTPFGLSGAILFSLPATCVSWYVPLGFFQTRRPRISALLPPDPEPGPCEDKEGVVTRLSTYSTSAPGKASLLFAP